MTESEKAEKAKQDEKKTESPRTFSQDMSATLIKHWKFFLGFLLGALFAIYFL